MTNSAPLIAYHGDPEVKAAILAQLKRHRAADEIVKGQYWCDGKGCAVGCTIYSGHHAEYEPRFGIPQMLACLEDQIFDGLPNHEAQDWPIAFMAAIEPGADGLGELGGMVRCGFGPRGRSVGHPLGRGSPSRLAAWDCGSGLRPAGLRAHVHCRFSGTG